MRRLVAAFLAGALALPVSACAPQRSDHMWQVSQVYLNSAATPTPPAPMYLVLGTSSFAGDTGCGPINGRLRTDEKEHTITVVRVRTPDRLTCDGAAEFYHDEFLRFFTGTLHEDRDGDELTLRNDAGESIHMVY